MSGSKKINLKSIIGAGEGGVQGKGKGGKRSEGGKGEEDRSSRATALEAPGSSRSRSVSLRRRSRSRDSSASSKKRRVGEDGSECEMSECESVHGERVNVGDDMNVSEDLRASVCTVRESDMDRDELVFMKAIGERMRKCVFTDTNRVNKSVTECMMSCMSDYEECVVRLMRKYERVVGQLEECKRYESACVCRPVQSVSAKSFASVVGTKSASVSVNEKNSVKAPTLRVNERKYAVVIKPRDESVKMTSEQVKEKVLSAVSKSLNVRVRAVRKTRSGGIAVETVSECEMKKMRECEKLKEIGMRVDEPRKIGAKVIVFDVPCNIPSEELISELYEKNLKECVSEKEFRESVRVISRTNKKDACVGNVIFEMGVRMWSRMMNEGRMYVGWRACKLKEWVSVLRCHKCCAFGHMARECKEKESVCQKCGESGHLKSVCKKNECCRNCRMKGKSSDHSVTSPECPEYLRMVERERARINAE